jgi:predicted secreted protein
MLAKKMRLTLVDLVKRGVISTTSIALIVTLMFFELASALEF